MTSLEVIKTITLEETTATKHFSSSSSSNSDSESIFITNARRKRHHIHHYVEIFIPRYSVEEFKQHFRLEKSTVERIILLYNNRGKPLRRGGRPDLSPSKAIYMTIWYLANRETFRQIADRFNVADSAAYSTIKNVAKFLVTLSSEYVYWPTEFEAERDSQIFERKKNLQHIIGAIDGSHIRINKPHIYADDYINRKGYYSVLLQGTVNSKMLFIDIVVGEPGSMHDARMLRKSKLYSVAYANPALLFYNKYALLGDSAYQSFNWLITPIKDNGHLNEEQRNFNYRHSSTRMVVENTFGHLKGRFRRLQNFENRSIPFIVNCITAACVLHNICITTRDECNDIYIGDND